MNVNSLGIFTVQCFQLWSCRRCNSKYISSILPLLDFSTFFNNGSGNALHFWNAPFSHGSSQMTIFFINFQAICDKQLRSNGKKMKKKRGKTMKDHLDFVYIAHQSMHRASSYLVFLRCNIPQIIFLNSYLLYFSFCIFSHFLLVKAWCK